MRMTDLIAKKRDGGALATEEIRWMIREYTGGGIPDYQMSSMCMAILLRGMDDREVLDLTMAMVHSGDVLDNRGYMAHGHASECGTSMMLYLHPELVDKSAITKTDPGPAGAGFTDFITYRRLKTRTAIALSGDAESATAEKGEKLFEIAVARILTFMEENF